MDPYFTENDHCWLFVKKISRVDDLLMLMQYLIFSLKPKVQNNLQSAMNQKKEFFSTHKISWKILQHLGHFDEKFQIINKRLTYKCKIRTFWRSVLSTYLLCRSWSTWPMYVYICIGITTTTLRNLGWLFKDEGTLTSKFGEVPRLNSEPRPHCVYNAWRRPNMGSEKTL